MFVQLQIFPHLCICLVTKRSSFYNAHVLTKLVIHADELACFFLAVAGFWQNRIQAHSVSQSSRSL